MTLIAGSNVVLFSVARLKAGAVSLPFNETFNTPSSDANFSSDYPAFTTTGTLTRTVDAGGVLHLGSGDFPATTWTTVVPSPIPVGGVKIQIDMGWDGGGVTPPGFGSAALKLGANVLAFHPGFGGPPAGAFRIEGPGGFGNQDMGFVPTIGVLNHVEILSLPSGQFNIKVTDGTNPANVYIATFTNASSYGGPIGPAALAGASGMFDNLSITAAPEPASFGLAAMALVGMASRGRRRFCRCSPIGRNKP
jgi:hypothetical protein